MNFDISTAMQLSATLTLIVGLGLRFAATGYPRAIQHPIDLWIRGMLIQPPAFFMFAMGAHIPALFSTVLANALLLLAFAHQMHALRVFNARSDGRLAMLGFGSAATVGVVLLTYLWPSLQGRIAVMSLAIAVLALFGVCAIYLGDRRRSRAEHLIAVFLLIGITIMVARIVLPPTSVNATLITYSPLQGIVFTYAALLPVVTTAAFTLMCGDRVNVDLARLAMIDPLTGVYNRRTMAELAARVVSSAQRNRQQLAVLALDVDHFKRINDEFGHDAGDQALCAIVDLVRSELRSDDVVSRLGGEEFVVVLPNTGEAQARDLAERIRNRVAGSGFMVAGWPAPLRVSIGVAALSASISAFEPLLHAADRALYTAKRAGRNRVVCVSQIDADSAFAQAG